jgi:hypothetical protein
MSFVKMATDMANQELDSKEVFSFRFQRNFIAENLSSKLELSEKIRN